MTVESLSVATAQIMNRKTVGTFLNMLAKVAAEYKPSDTPGNSSDIDESGIQINKNLTVITEKGSKNFNAVTSREKSENIAVRAFCTTSGQFLPPLF
jgi:ribonuclease HIII